MLFGSRDLRQKLRLSSRHVDKLNLSMIMRKALHCADSSIPKSKALRPFFRLGSSFLLATLFALAPSLALSQCGEGDGSFLCYGEDGAEYNVIRNGNTTFLEAISPSGSTWSQESYRTGNVIEHFGIGANGNTWFMTQTINPDGSHTYDGIDANGQLISSTCETNGNCY